MGKGVILVRGNVMGIFRACVTVVHDARHLFRILCPNIWGFRRVRSNFALWYLVTEKSISSIPAGLGAVFDTVKQPFIDTHCIVFYPSKG